MKFKDDKRLVDILLEMPQWAEPIGDVAFEKFTSMSYDELVTRTKYFTHFQDMDVMISKSPTLDVLNYTFLFLKNKQLVSAYNFDKHPKNIQTKISWSDINNKGLFYNIFTNFIIPSFNTVESDGMLTDLGYKFWEKLMRTHPEFNYYIKNNESYTQINKSEDLKRYFGKDKSYRNYTYVVSTR